MKDVQLDVIIEVPYTSWHNNHTLDTRKNPIMQLIRHQAEKKAAEAKGRLRLDRQVETLIRRGAAYDGSGDHVQIATRWWAEVPDSFAR